MVQLLRLASVLGLVISCLLAGSILNTLGTGTLQSLMNSANLRGSQPRANCHNTRYQGLSNKELECLRTLERVFLDSSRDNTKKGSYSRGKPL